MEEITSLIFHGCKLARNLEENLNHPPNFVNQQPPNILSKSCDEIIRVFSAARERLINPQTQSLISYGQTNVPQVGELGGRVEEWLRYNTQAMGCLIQLPESKLAAGAMRGKEGSVQFRAGGGETQPLEVLDSGRGSSSSSQSQRRRRRTDDADKTIVRLPAPQVGNTEIQPDDGFTWRKYGQKVILGSRFPRGYYRCTHQKLYQCPAKKQVQRLDDDPFTFEVTYLGNHICHMSSTAPSLPPPSATIVPHMIPQSTTSTITAQPPSPPTSARWLTMDIQPIDRGMTGAFTNPHEQMWVREGISGSGMVGNAVAGPSNVRYGGMMSNFDYQFHVADLADAMFNSGGSGNSNSVDFIFSSSMEEDK